MTQNLYPTNLEQEKRKFLFDPEYNPQFEYEDDIDEDSLTRHGDVSEDLLPTAKYILNKVLKQWPNDEQYVLETEGSVLTQPEVEQTIRSYLQRHNLENIVSISYSAKMAARTSVTGHILNIRTPLSYRAQGILGMLEHEVGVHILRRLNDEKQPWRGERSKFDLHQYLKTEEGLAVLHSHIIRDDKHLWIPALSYYCVYLAHQMSFSQLFRELKPFVTDQNKLWNICFKAKRGLRDTSQPGGYTKNQLYLVGVVEVLRWLKANHFDPRPLYYGKLALEDIEFMKSQSNLAVEDLWVPQLLHNQEWYKEQAMKIVRENKLPL